MGEVISKAAWLTEKYFNLSFGEILANNYSPDHLATMNEAACKSKGYFVLDIEGGTMLEWKTLAAVLLVAPALKVKRDPNYPRLIYFLGYTKELLEAIKK